MGQGYAFKVITQLKNTKETPDLAFNTPEARRELIAKVLFEVENRLRKQKEEKENSSLLADGDMFNGLDGKPLRKVPKRREGSTVRRTVGALKDFSDTQHMAYVELKKSANKSVKGQKGPHYDFFKSITRQNERRRKLAKGSSVA